MKKKRIIIIILLTILIIFKIGFTIYQNQSINVEILKIYNENKNDVDNGINKLINSKNYKQMNEEERAENVGELLKLYKKNKKIKSLYYSKEELMYSFEYTNKDLDGSLGGVKIKEFDSRFN